MKIELENGSGVPEEYASTTVFLNAFVERDR